MKKLALIAFLLTALCALGQTTGLSKVRGVGALPSTCQPATSTQPGDVIIYNNQLGTCGSDGHSWNFGTGGSGSFTAAGDLSGSSSSQTVTGIKGYVLPSLSTGYLHWTGSSWVMDVPGGGFSAAGDLSGSASSQQVVGIRGNSVPALTTGYLHWNGTQFVFDTPSGSGGGLADPGSNGIMKRTALNTTSAATMADLIALLGYTPLNPANNLSDVTPATARTNLGITYANLPDKPTIPAASSTTPSMDGAGSAGSSTNFARADHVHPTDTTRLAASAVSNDSTLGGGTPSTSNPPTQSAVQQYVAAHAGGNPGGTSSPTAGSIQYNNGGFAGDSNLTYNSSTHTLSVPNVNAQSVTGLTGNIGATNVIMGGMPAAGTGIYLITGTGGNPSGISGGCVSIFASVDGKSVRPLFWPTDQLGPCSLNPNVWGVSGVTATFYAPWNNTYYVAGVHPSTNVAAPQVCIAQSKDLTNWAPVTASPANGCFNINGYSYSDIASFFYDDATSCPAQDYSCLHGIVQFGSSGDSNIHNGETHPLNASLTAWSSIVAFTGLNDTQNSWDPSVFKFGSTYYLLHDESDAYMVSYYLYSGPSVTGPWTKVSSTPYTGTSFSGSCHVVDATHGCESGTIIQSDTGTYRLYYHDTFSSAGMYWMETSDPTQVPGTWTAPVAISGTNDFAINRANTIRTSDMRTVMNVAAIARQTLVPFDTPRGGMVPYSTWAGAAIQGTWWGLEHVMAAHNTTQNYDALHIVGPNPSIVDANIDIGNHPTALSGSSPMLNYFNVWAHFEPTKAYVVGSFKAASYSGQLRNCTIQLGDDSSPSVLTTANIQPQKSLCKIPEAGTLKEVDVMVDAGASTVQVGYRHSGSTTAVTPLLTPATVAGVTDKVACANTSGTSVTIEGSSVNCSTLSSTALAVADFIETVGGAADGTSKRMTITLQWTAN